MSIPFSDFEKVHIRVGEIVKAEIFAKARKPAYKLLIDFGPELGLKKSSAQITVHYQPKDLIGKQVLAVVNFEPRQIADFMSEVLVLGLPDENGDIVLLTPDKMVPAGGRVY
jgi:tRNA-binding protein